MAYHRLSGLDHTIPFSEGGGNTHHNGGGGFKLISNENNRVPADSTQVNAYVWWSGKHAGEDGGRGLGF